MDAQSIPSMTVKVNVGGRLFEVPRDVIDQQPDSTLGQMMEQDDSEEPVMIDRSSEIFNEVLEYLLYGSVILPANLPKEKFTQDLKFYAIVYEEDCIDEFEEAIT